jgi:hypothetical protein
MPELGFYGGNRGTYPTVSGKLTSVFRRDEDAFWRDELTAVYDTWG